MKGMDLAINNVFETTKGRLYEVTKLEIEEVRY